MSRYLLIESRDPFDSNDTGFLQDLAGGLLRDGHEVTLFLVQNAVLQLRSARYAQRLRELTGTGISILADDFSLRQRGIPVDVAAGSVDVVPLDTVIDALAAGVRTLWH